GGVEALEVLEHAVAIEVLLDTPASVGVVQRFGAEQAGAIGVRALAQDPAIRRLELEAVAHAVLVVVVPDGPGPVGIEVGLGLRHAVLVVVPSLVDAPTVAREVLGALRASILVRVVRGGALPASAGEARDRLGEAIAIRVDGLGRDLAGVLPPE